MRWIAAKVLILSGACVLVFSLLNGLGLNASGEPSLEKEVFLLLLGAVLLAIGVTLEPRRATAVATPAQAAEEVSK